MFEQSLDPLGNVALTCLVALIPLAVLMVSLAVFRITAWLSALIGLIATFIIAALAWQMPVSDGVEVGSYGLLAGAWQINWITLWGVMLFNTLIITGNFERFRLWLISVGTADVRVQTMLFAWAFGALLEGLVGFGYPWAVIAPILIALGIPALDAIRVAALANNAPCSYGALGVPIITMAAVTGLPLMDLSASIGKLVAVLALAPPWILIYLVSGKRGLRDGWPLAVVGSLGFIAGQFPVSNYIGPYLPDIAGSITCFTCLLILMRVWRPAEPLGYGGVPIPGGWEAAQIGRLSMPETLRAWTPFLVLVAVGVAWTGPWSNLPKILWWHPSISALDSIEKMPLVIDFKFAPWSSGTAVLVSWIIVALLMRLSFSQLKEIFGKTLRQMWGAFLVGPLVFALANIFNYSGMAGSLANGLSKIGVAFILVAPILGWIGAALSGSNTATNVMFGHIQMLVGRILGFPPLLFPSLNSVGAEIGKPVAPTTAAVGVSTSTLVRSEGQVIRHNMSWTLILLAYLIVVGVVFYLVFPETMMVKTLKP